MRIRLHQTRPNECLVPGRLPKATPQLCCAIEKIVAICVDILKYEVVVTEENLITTYCGGTLIAACTSPHTRRAWLIVAGNQMSS